MFELPTEIEIGEKTFAIRKRGDYRMVLDVFSVLEDYTLTQTERIVSALIIFYEDLDGIEDIGIFPDLEEAVRKMFNFFNAEREEGRHQNYKLIDWEKDTAMIASAINNVAHTEIRSEEYIHWWTFIGYYMSIGESTLSTVVSIRDKIVKGKSLEKWEREFRMENPQYFSWNSKTVEEKEAESWVMEMWNKE